MKLFVRPLISSAQIQQRVAELGDAITRDYADRDLLLVGVLTGVFVFIADLIRAIDLRVEVDFIGVTHFSPGDRRGIRLLKDLDVPIAERHVLLVEDLVDTGLTLQYLLRSLRARQPASVQICTLIDQPRRRLVHLPIAYRGFELESSYLVGYGLDYKGQGRYLDAIGEVSSPKK